MILNWIKCGGQQWCDFLKLSLDHPHFNNLEGVYIIWHGGSNASVVRVGQGVIRERLMVHREDPAILKYKDFNLFATWAAVSTLYRDGVERYLAEKWNPKVGDKFPDSPAIEVNSPW